MENYYKISQTLIV